MTFKNYNQSVEDEMRKRDPMDIGCPAGDDAEKNSNHRSSTSFVILVD
jgi:hypothetical protein